MTEWLIVRDVSWIPAIEARGGPNVGWGDGSLPFLLVVVPIIAFVIWFEFNRRKESSLIAPAPSLVRLGPRR